MEDEGKKDTSEKNGTENYKNRKSLYHNTSVLREKMRKRETRSYQPHHGWKICKEDTSFDYCPYPLRNAFSGNR